MQPACHPAPGNHRPRDRRSRACRLAFVTAAAVGLFAAGCVTSPRQAATGDSVPPAPYTRVINPDTNTFALQIALRKFVPRGGRGPVVWLSGVSHIGESNYYAGLQRHLDSQNLVLFEGVGARERTPRFDPAEQSSLQHTLAQSLGLVFQLTAIDYDRPHFRNCDLTVAEMQRLLADTAEAGDRATDAPPDGDDDGAGGREFHELMGVMNGSSVLGMLVHLGVRFLGSSPKLQAMMKLAMIETLGSFQGDLGEVKNLPPEIQRLMAVIIRRRNEVVIRDLRQQLGPAATSARRSIAVFYGAGHMADLEKRLVAELGYRPREAVWMTALSVDTRAAGLSAAELQMVRNLVQWQLDTLRAR